MLSKDEKNDYVEPTAASGEPAHEGGVQDGTGGKWRRDDMQGIDERAKHGFTLKTGRGGHV
eukprot:97814-Pleurochrysis_carterae.AAC.2